MEYSKRIYKKDPKKLARFESPYFEYHYNLLRTVPILLVLCLSALAVGFLSTQRESKVSPYLEQASKWNEENIAELMSEVRMIAHVMPS